MSARKRARNFTWREAWPIWLTLGILFGFGVLGVYVLVPNAQTTATSLRRDEDVKLNVGGLQPDLPKLFAYPLEQGSTTEFFVERNAGNGITVAFASCRRCYRAGHYRQGGQILCGQCKEQMERATEGQTLPAEKDCTQIPIPFDGSGELLTIRATAVRNTFTQWYVPVIARDGNSANGNHK